MKVFLGRTLQNQGLLRFASMFTLLRPVSTTHTQKYPNRYETDSMKFYPIYSKLLSKICPYPLHSCQVPQLVKQKVSRFKSLTVTLLWCHRKRGVHSWRCDSLITFVLQIVELWLWLNNAKLEIIFSFKPEDTDNSKLSDFSFVEWVKAIQIWRWSGMDLGAQKLH